MEHSVNQHLLKLYPMESQIFHLKQERENSLRNLIKIKKQISSQIWELIDLLRHREEDLNHKIQAFSFQQNWYYENLLQKCYSLMNSEENDFGKQRCPPEPVLKYEAQFYELKENIKQFGKLSTVFMTENYMSYRNEIEEEKEVFDEQEASNVSNNQNLTKTVSLDSFEVIEKVEMQAEEIKNLKKCPQADQSPSPFINSVKKSYKVSDWLYKSLEDSEHDKKIDISPDTVELVDREEMADYLVNGEYVYKISDEVIPYVESELKKKDIKDYPCSFRANLNQNLIKLCRSHELLQNLAKIKAKQNDKFDFKNWLPNEDINVAKCLNPSCACEKPEKVIENAFSSYFIKDPKKWLC